MYACIYVYIINEATAVNIKDKRRHKIPLINVRNYKTIDKRNKTETKIIAKL